MGRCLGNRNTQAIRKSSCSCDLTLSIRPLPSLWLTLWPVRCKSWNWKRKLMKESCRAIAKIKDYFIRLSSNFKDELLAWCFMLTISTLSFFKKDAELEERKVLGLWQLLYFADPLAREILLSYWWKIFQIHSDFLNELTEITIQLYHIVIGHQILKS